MIFLELSFFPSVGWVFYRFILIYFILKQKWVLSVLKCKFISNSCFQRNKKCKLGDTNVDFLYLLITFGEYTRIGSKSCRVFDDWYIYLPKTNHSILKRLAMQKKWYLSDYERKWDNGNLSLMKEIGISYMTIIEYSIIINCVLINFIVFSN